jgi:hypothetical protein
MFHKAFANLMIDSSYKPAFPVFYFSDQAIYSFLLQGLPEVLVVSMKMQSQPIRYTLGQAAVVAKLMLYCIAPRPPVTFSGYFSHSYLESLFL